MTRVCPNINWRSFVPIFLKLDKDITKIKETFLRGVGVSDGSVVGALTSIYYALSARLVGATHLTHCTL